MTAKRHDPEDTGWRRVDWKFVADLSEEIGATK
jgi:hypothetical protein